MDFPCLMDFCLSIYYNSIVGINPDWLNTKPDDFSESHIPREYKYFMSFDELPSGRLRAVKHGVNCRKHRLRYFARLRVILPFGASFDLTERSLLK